MCRPQSLARRWAGLRAKRRASPGLGRQCKFLVSHRVGKMLKSVSVFLKCAVFIALRRRRIRAVFWWRLCVVLCWQNVKICECLLATPSFQCIGGGSVPPPLVRRCLAGRYKIFGRAARQSVPPQRIYAGLGGGAKSFFSVVLWQNVGGGATAIFWAVVSCWQNVTFCERLLEMPSFQCIGGGSVPPPMQLPDAGPGGAPKGASPGLGGGLNAIFCLVSGASCVGKRVAGVKQVWQCSVLLGVWRRYELRLLKLL